VLCEFQYGCLALCALALVVVLRSFGDRVEVLAVSVSLSPSFGSHPNLARYKSSYLLIFSKLSSNSSKLSSSFRYPIVILQVQDLLPWRSGHPRSNAGLEPINGKGDRISGGRGRVRTYQGERRKNNWRKRQSVVSSREALDLAVAGGHDSRGLSRYRHRRACERARRHGEMNGVSRETTSGGFWSSESPGRPSDWGQLQWTALGSSQGPTPYWPKWAEARRYGRPKR
jgi:hypothetical protein